MPHALLCLLFTLLGTLGCGETRLLEVRGPCSYEKTFGPQEEPLEDPADIIFVVDTSGSMQDEAAFVRDNLSQFMTDLQNGNVDSRVILIMDGEGYVTPPENLDPDRVLWVQHRVSSINALEVLLESYPSYAHFLQPGSTRHVVVVSDDESDWTANQFWDAVEALPGTGFGEALVLHAIVSDNPQLARGCDTGTLYGATYVKLSQQTGGLVESVCAAHWAPTFFALVNSVSAAGGLPCQLFIPDNLPEGAQFSPHATSLEYGSSDGLTVGLRQVQAPEECGRWSWYYDNPSSPNLIQACPETCNTFRTQEAQNLKVKLDCQWID